MRACTMLLTARRSSSATTLQHKHAHPWVHDDLRIQSCISKTEGQEQESQTDEASVCSPTHCTCGTQN